MSVCSVYVGDQTLTIGMLFLKPLTNDVLLIGASDQKTNMFCSKGHRETTYLLFNKENLMVV